ncbi:MAG: type II restriction endonuclease [Deltaproteobacteria bacterium HGW-Deltaproteobacteria-13]|jgi:hypothetical protein|nr:MAG: type II restriction endonuclease [Deltaproteobacteria bacterium HGW-Deltaproteobacteria-13]
MKLNILTPRQALNKAFLKVKPNRNDIECFKSNFIKLINHINEAESEEFHKNIISDFLKDTYYKENHFINTKGRNDLVIHNGKDAKSSVGVIIETKKPANKSEMLRADNINVKAFQELILYYLRERITLKNLEIKYLVATDIYEWFIFDAQLFERLFINNRQLIKKFTDFEERRLADIRTDFFYKEIAEPFINGIEAEITFTHFDIRDFDKPLRNADKQDDNQLIALYKLLSPEHLLKLPFTNDSNSLDKSFYTELLHIIGLVETKEGGKKLIGRKKEGERNLGSIMESAIVQLESLDKISRLEKAHHFGATNNERLFNVALELSITWINRILFLKLLEAQLINYNKGDKSFSFLHLERVRNFDDLNSLFFQVLARKPEARSEQIKKLFAKVPYLNSSLFEPTEIEHNGLFISQLRDTHLPILGSTVLKDKTGKKRTGTLDTLEYLFEFLDAYDFAGEGAEEIQEDNKTLINASVLGLIFEKINGYKDGSFFTPGFITMYMCRETIRRAVVQKFNDAKKWNCQGINQLYDKIEDRQEANQIINSLKICDPAVGSGHFLVSALNEIIAIKNDLKILSDREGKRLKEYSVEVVSDELIITDEDGNIFEYNPKNKESQRIQETLFHEKQTIIENCLFGVDINPNSVKICRLRLWIELLKNAYYKEPAVTELETLPNIDINIKCGNSLVSRYQLDADIKEALRQSKWSIDSYRLAVMTYRNAENKNQKQAMEKLIDEIKSNFESEVAAGDRRVIRLKNIKDDLKTHAQQTHIFELTKAQKSDWEKKLKKLTADITKLEAELEEIKNNKIYENAFEWRFEFPEVLNDDGYFVGFDVVIGNPPYIAGKDLDTDFKEYIKSNYPNTIGKFDVYITFIEQGLNILRNRKNLCFIIPNTILTNENAQLLRASLLKNKLINKITLLDDKVFEEAFVESIIIELDNQANHEIIELVNKSFKLIRKIEYSEFDESKDKRIQVYFNINDRFINNKIAKISIKLGNIVDFCIGIQIGGEGNSKDFKNEFISTTKLDDSYKKILDGKDFDTYKINWPNKFIKYGDWLHRKRDDKYFLNPKIIIRQIGATPFATIDFDNYYTLNTIYNGILLNKDFNINYVFALINSKLNKYIWTQIFFDGKALFPKIKKSQLNEILIANISLTEQEPFIELVNCIFTAKKQDPNADIGSLEKEIDKLVYQLYGLTEEEIKIVEQN